MTVIDSSDVRAILTLILAVVWTASQFMTTIPAAPMINGLMSMAAAFWLNSKGQK